MAEGVIFDRQSAARIADAVREVEGDPVDLTGNRTPTPVARRETIWAKLTGRDGTDKWKYAWTEQRRKADGTWEDLPQGRTGTTTENPALEKDKSTSDLTGKVVQLRRTPVLDSAGPPPVFKLAWTFTVATGVDVMNHNTVAVAQTPFINLPDTNGTKDVLEFVAHTTPAPDNKAGAALKLKPGQFQNQTLRWTGTVWMIDFLKFS